MLRFRLLMTAGAALGWLVLSLCACDEKETIASYHARGVLKEVTGSGDELRMSIHHERVPSFKDRDGHASDMESMTMIFGLAPQVSPQAVVAGDKLAFDFEVHWSQAPALRITKIQKLAPETTLTLKGEP